jgi:hypothetical protein
LRICSPHKSGRPDLRRERVWVRGYGLSWPIAPHSIWCANPRGGAKKLSHRASTDDQPLKSELDLSRTREFVRTMNGSDYNASLINESSRDLKIILAFADKGPSIDHKVVLLCDQR